ncbi:hypothetical protein D3C77_531280 [compost metagenome]
MRTMSKPSSTDVAAVIIGTNRLPAKNPRYEGSSILKNRLYIAAASTPTIIPPNTPVARVGIPRTSA